MTYYVLFRLAYPRTAAQNDYFAKSYYSQIDYFAELPLAKNNCVALTKFLDISFWQKIKKVINKRIDLLSRNEVSYDFFFWNNATYLSVNNNINLVGMYTCMNCEFTLFLWIKHDNNYFTYVFFI